MAWRKNRVFEAEERGSKNKGLMVLGAVTVACFVVAALLPSD